MLRIFLKFECLCELPNAASFGVDEISYSDQLTAVGIGQIIYGSPKLAWAAIVAIESIRVSQKAVMAEPGQNAYCFLLRYVEALRYERS